MKIIILAALFAAVLNAPYDVIFACSGEHIAKIDGPTYAADQSEWKEGRANFQTYQQICGELLQKNIPNPIKNRLRAGMASFLLKDDLIQMCILEPEVKIF